MAESVVTTNLALIGVSALGLVITARYLGVSDRGLYLTWSSWSAMVGTLAMLGTQPFIVVAAEQVGARVSVWRFRAMLGVGMGVAILSSATAMWWLRAGAIAAAGGVLMATSGPIVAVHAAVQQANGHHGWRFNVARALSPIAGFSAVVAVLMLFRPGVEGLFLGLGLGCFVGAVLAVVVASEPAASHPELPARIRALSLRGAPLVLLGWMLLNVDTVVVSIAGTTQDVGLYGVGLAARSVVLSLGTAVGLRWFAKRGPLGTPRDAVGQFIPAALVALGIATSAPVAVPLVLGKPFAPAVPAVTLLAIGGTFAAADFLLGHVLLLRVGYVSPTILRLGLVATLALGIFAVDGNPTLSALVFCLVMFGSVIGQLWIGWRHRGGSNKSGG